MKKALVLIFASMVLIVSLTSCRPPELEGAFVDYNAGRVDKALKLARKATSLYPDNSEAWFLLGKIYADKGKYDSMMVAFDKSLAIDNSHKSEIDKMKIFNFQKVYNKAAKSFNTYTQSSNRQSDTARQALEAAIENFKNALTIREDYKANELTGYCYNLLGKPDKALPYYQNLTEIKPDTVHAWLSLANQYYTKKDFQKVTEHLQKALEIDPNNEEALALIAQTYDQLNKRDEAIEYYTRVIKVNDEEKAYPFNLALLYIKTTSMDTTLDEATKNDYLQKSTKYFGKVIELDSSMIEPYKLKAQAEVQLKRFEDALNTVEKGIEIFPEDEDLWFMKSVALSNLNKKDAAEAAYLKAKELGYES